MAAVGQGFVEDYVPENPRIAFIMDMPSRDDGIEHRPLSGDQGAYYRALLIDGSGLALDQVLVAHVIRCVQPCDPRGKPMYPRGYLQKQAELNCRYYDSHTVGNGKGNLIGFDPDVFVLTHHPREIFNVGCYRVQIQRDVQKAVSFLHRGHRPAVLFGLGAAVLYFPWLDGNGGLKNWRGHWWVGESPFKEQKQVEMSARRKLFVEA